ncbi:MAG TPA: sel1 repeat family protein [Pelagibacterales bacterium]|nr:sel1 repeat family protein [Pelagibacterales bacterium]
MSQMNQHLLAESELNLETIDLQQRAYTGDAEAQYALANIFQKGIHVQKNTKHAFYWYQSAAHQGNLLAQYNVWFAYLTGEGIQANTQQANKWFARASLKNSRSAQSIVAQLLDTTIH